MTRYLNQRQPLEQRGIRVIGRAVSTFHPRQSACSLVHASSILPSVGFSKTSSASTNYKVIPDSIRFWDRETECITKVLSTRRFLYAAILLWYLHSTCTFWSIRLIPAEVSSPQIP